MSPDDVIATPLNDVETDIIIIIIIIINQKLTGSDPCSTADPRAMSMNNNKNNNNKNNNYIKEGWLAISDTLLL